MTLRITVTGRGDETVLKVDGWLSGEDTEELIRAVRDCLRAPVLDLSDLRFASSEGLAVLAELRDRGIRLVRPRPLVAMLLQGRDAEDEAAERECQSPLTPSWPPARPK